MLQNYASPAFVIADDFNQTNKQWVSSVLDLQLVVKIPNHQSSSILDLILTNLTDFYDAPRSLGPHQNSDYFIISWEANSAIPNTERVKTTMRPITRDSISAFDCWIGNYEFDGIYSKLDVNVKVSKLNSLIQEKFQAFFPT